MDNLLKTKTPKTIKQCEEDTVQNSQPVSIGCKKIANNDSYHASTVPIQTESSNPVSTVTRDIVQMLKAPSVDLDVFRGDPLEYDYFKSNFSQVVETTVEDQRGRLARLIKYTNGDAKDLIKLCVYNDPSCCYDNAVMFLDKEYGNASKIASAYLKQLREWPSVKITDCVALKKLYIFLLKCQIYKRKGSLEVLDSAMLIRTVLAKLDTSYHEKWRLRTENTRRKDAREATFDDLIDFIDFHACSSSYPAYSRDMMKEAKERCFRVCFQEVTENNEEYCLFCITNGGQAMHTTDSCPAYLTSDSKCFFCINCVLDV